MEKEISVSDNELQSATELTQASTVEVSTGKMLWHSPKLRAIQVSQETCCIGSAPCN